MGLPLDGPSEDWISNCDPEDSASDISSIKEDNDLPETDEPRPASPGSNKFNHKAWARCTKAEHICELADQGPIGYWLDAEAGFPVGQPCLTHQQTALSFRLALKNLVSVAPLTGMCRTHSCPGNPYSWVLATLQLAPLGGAVWYHLPLHVTGVFLMKKLANG
ncbi:hypothetical protein RSOL_177690, partial [Rhizoctonia solani AG-3 Rhs1AP]